MRQQPRHSEHWRLMQRAAQENERDTLFVIFFNPIYGYGKWLEPREIVADQVFIRNVELADRQKKLGRALTLDELDAEYTALMADLIRTGRCVYVQDVPPAVTKEKWLRAQQTAIGRIMRGEEL